MGHSFAISDNLYVRRWYIPSAWEYRNPWPPEHVLEQLEDWPASEYDWLIVRGMIGEADLIRAGNVLSRYCRRLVRAGKDY